MSKQPKNQTNNKSFQNRQRPIRRKFVNSSGVSYSAFRSEMFKIRRRLSQVKGRIKHILQMNKKSNPSVPVSDSSESHKEEEN